MELSLLSPFNVQLKRTNASDIRDLIRGHSGININGSLNFNFHSDMLYSKANQRLGEENMSLY